MRNGDCVQSIKICLWCFHLYSLQLFYCGTSPTGSSFSQTDPMWASYRLQFSKSSSNMGPYYEVQFFRSRLFQNGSPKRSGSQQTFCMDSSWATWPIVCSCRSSPWTAASFRPDPPASLWGPPQAAMWRSVLMWYTMGCRGTSCYTSVLSRHSITAAVVP